MSMRRAYGVAIVVGLLVAGSVELSAYSVLAHESAIDEAWDKELRPLLLRRFPGTSAAALERARSFAYGGSLIQDLGYYPFGNKFFSNLLHYARSGDFVQALIRNAHDVDEFAFALGALAHYANDNTGHPEAVNLAVPLIFPKLRAKFGDVVTYVEAPKQHVIVEFSNDVAQAARGRYSFTQYRSLIDFQVSLPLLERAFRDTYDLEMSDVFGDEERAISTYRFAVSQLIPTLTRAAWRDKAKELAQLAATADANGGVVFAYTARNYEKDYGQGYQKPAAFARFLGVIYWIVPKVGPLKPLAFKTPTPEVDKMFVASLNEAHARFARLVRDLRDGRLRLDNTNFDTGRPTRANEYAHADVTYAEWLETLSKRDFAGTSPAVRRELTAFYEKASLPQDANRRARKQWAEVQADVVRLQGATAALATSADAR